jgi:hypothetical protein
MREAHQEKTKIIQDAVKRQRSSSNKKIIADIYNIISECSKLDRVEKLFNAPTKKYKQNIDNIGFLDMCAPNADKVLRSPLKVDRNMIAEAVYPLSKNEYEVSDEVFFTYTRMNQYSLNKNSKLITALPKEQLPLFQSSFDALAKLNQERLQTYNLARLGHLITMKKHIKQALSKKNNITIKGLKSLSFLTPKKVPAKKVSTKNI